MKGHSLFFAAGTVSLALFAIPAAVQAAESPSFDNIGISYVDIDFNSRSLTGFAINAEKTLPFGFFLSADALNFAENFGDRVVIDGVGNEAKYRYSFLNANLNYKLVDRGGFTAYAGAGLSYVKDEVIVRGQFSDSNSENGWNMLVGIRHAITSVIELDANIRHLNIADSSEQIISVGARLYPSNRISLNLGYTEIHNNFTYIEFGVSYHF
ncbi:MAG: porin family protein [Idiomarina sp.]|nr:porin family protein [Idiomarina sp.]